MRDLLASPHLTLFKRRWPLAIVIGAGVGVASYVFKMQGHSSWLVVDVVAGAGVMLFSVLVASVLDSIVSTDRASRG
jgi:hypothetical protein